MTEPERTAACTYCGSDVEAHQPIYVSGHEDGERVSVGEFCNYACLSAHIDEEGLVYGTSCSFDP